MFFDCHFPDLWSTLVLIYTTGMTLLEILHPHYCQFNEHANDNCKGFGMKRSRYSLGVYKFFKILGASLKIPGARRVTWRRLQTGDPQMSGATHHELSRLVVLASVICALLVWLICLSPRICQEALAGEKKNVKYVSVARVPADFRNTQFLSTLQKRYFLEPICRCISLSWHYIWR